MEIYSRHISAAGRKDRHAPIGPRRFAVHLSDTFLIIPLSLSSSSQLTRRVASKAPELVWKVRQDFPVFEWISAVCDLPVLARHAMKA